MDSSAQSLAADLRNRQWLRCRCCLVFKACCPSWSHFWAWLLLSPPPCLPSCIMGCSLPPYLPSLSLFMISLVFHPTHDFTLVSNLSPSTLWMVTVLRFAWLYICYHLSTRLPFSQRRRFANHLQPTTTFNLRCLRPQIPWNEIDLKTICLLRCGSSLS